MFSTPASGHDLSGLTNGATETSAENRGNTAQTPDFPNDQRLERTAPPAGEPNVGRLAQPVAASALHAEGRGFDPLTAHHKSNPEEILRSCRYCGSEPGTCECASEAAQEIPHHVCRPGPCPASHRRDGTVSDPTAEFPTVSIWLGGGKVMMVPKKSYDEALTMATLTNRRWYVGLTRDGACEVGPFFDELAAKGCSEIAFISPPKKLSDA